MQFTMTSDYGCSTWMNPLTQHPDFKKKGLVGKKGEMLVTSNFSFSRNVLHPMKDRYLNFSII